MAEGVAFASDRRVRAPTAVLTIVMLFVAIAALAGGSSWNARTPLLVVELASIPVMALAAREMALKGTWREARAPIVLAALVAAIPLIQSIPLPPAIWTSLPGQSPRYAAYVLSGLDLGWEPISLDPGATRVCLAALVPPLALLLAGLVIPDAGRRTLAGVWILVALAGVMLGLVQLTQAQGGWAYPYTETNAGSLVGWFANRNHEAALLLALTPLAAALLPRPGWTRWAAGPLLLLALVALAADKSRAGVIIAAPVVLGSFAVLQRGRRGGLGRWAPLAFLGVAALSIAAVTMFALTPLLNRFDGGQPEFRLEAWPVIWAEALRHLPFGAGVGAFDRVFRAAEPLSLVGPKFFNHAHNDFLEAFLEGGWLAVVAGLAVLAWFAVQARRAWSRDGSDLARAATVSIASLLAMSSVDYPLRTETLACLFAFLCALLVAPRSRPG